MREEYLDAISELEEALSPFHLESDGEWSNYDEFNTSTIRLAIEALEKQVEKKPKKLSYEPLIKHGWEYECPECSKAIGINSVGFDFTDKDPFCPSCGQKIDWSDE